MTKNITLAVDEGVLAKVRRIAANRDTTVNGLVRDYLTRLADQDDKVKDAVRQLEQLADRSDWDPGEDWRWNREELHDRPALRRHEHPDLRGIEPRPRPGKKKKSA